jgi:hypothetical protein
MSPRLFLLLTTSALLLCQSQAMAALTAAEGGQWGSVYDLDVVAVHVAVLPSGNQDKTDVLIVEGENNNAADDPTVNVTTARVLTIPTNGQPSSNKVLNYSEGNLFCSGLAVGSDGLVHIAGGQDKYNGDGAKNGVGFKSIGGFAWITESDPPSAHWYGTGINSKSGYFLYGGLIAAGEYNTTPEIYNAATNTWRALTGVTVSTGNYPFIFQAPNGEIFDALLPKVGFINTTNTGHWRNGPSGSANHFNGTAADVDDQVYVIGGGKATTSVQRFNLTSLRTNATAIGSMANATGVNVGRSYANVTILADGSLLYTGGSRTGSRTVVSSAEKRPELRNMSTGAWTFMNPEQEPRLYHSTAFLLMDGRVASAGGGLDQLDGATDFKNLQIFSPPYLFYDNRPAITAAPTNIHFKTNFTLGVQGTIQNVTLVGLSGVTHAFNGGQSLHTLTFTQAGSTLTVTPPANSNMVPSNYYMLFVINDHGVPSVARMVKLS